MTAKPHHKQILLIKAKEDLETAVSLTSLGKFSEEIVLFHCQQAVEKALKAYLDSINIIYPKSHDLEALLAICQEKDNTFEQIGFITSLTPYAVEIRYDEFVSLGTEEITNLVSQTKKAFGFIINKIS